MTSTHASLNTGPSLATMARIETRRLARNPFLIVSTLISFGLLVWFALGSHHDTPGDLLSWPVVPAFFIGLTSLAVVARQTRSTESAGEALGTAPGTEARRTQALAIACLLPAALGLVFILATVAVAQWKGVAAQEWWFGTMNDAQVWSALIALGPVACLGGGLLGILVGRWLRFPGSAAVVIVGLVVVDMLGQYPAEEMSFSQLRLVMPWSSFQSGTNEETGSATLYAGSAVFYLIYLLCLCAAAYIAAVWHDRNARTRQLRSAFAFVVVLGVLACGLSMTTGTSDNRESDPVPWLVPQ